MHSSRSALMFFTVSDDSLRQQVIRQLSSVFHVVPAELPDTDGRVVSVEIAGDHLDLRDEVRGLVARADPGSLQLHHDGS